MNYLLLNFILKRSNSEPPVLLWSIFRQKNALSLSYSFLVGPKTIIEKMFYYENQYYKSLFCVIQSIFKAYQKQYINRYTFCDL